MTLDEIYQQLQNLANSGDPTFTNAAQFVGQITQQAQHGQMSKEELTETLQDVQRQISIIQDMNQLRYKENLNTCINEIITIASLAI